MTAERIVIRTLGVLAAVAFAGCGTHPPADTREAPAIGSYQGFGAVERVTILGYDGDAMEPFITRDGRFLLFNNRNDPKIDTKLLVAERRDDVTFVYRGELAGSTRRPSKASRAWIVGATCISSPRGATTRRSRHSIADDLRTAA
ncbi:MAG: hypothetical protein HC882_05415 [Acidobacteria bacterium]|nr:hypothetical protein [Acidobacteriota bacterium]